MHRLDEAAQVLREVPGGEQCRKVTGRECWPTPVVDGDPIWRRRRNLASVEGGDGLRDRRPCMRVWCRFAGEIAGVEFGDGGIYIVRFEHDDRPDLVVEVGLDDAEHFVDEIRIAGMRTGDTRQGEALPAV